MSEEQELQDAVDRQSSRSRRQIRDALFTYFLWKFPARTDGRILIQLTDEALARVEQVLEDYHNAPELE